MEKGNDTFWKIIQGESITQQDLIKDGCIMVHKSGVLLLRCPKCNSLQFNVNFIDNSTEFLTLKNKIICGSGICKKCMFEFFISNGKTVQSE